MKNSIVILLTFFLSGCVLDKYINFDEIEKLETKNNIARPQIQGTLIDTQSYYVQRVELGGRTIHMVRYGEFPLENLNTNVVSRKSEGSQVFSYVKGPGQTAAVMTGGPWLTSIPKGKFTYTGFNAVTTRSGNYIEGTFNMYVDFDQSTGSLEAMTPETNDFYPTTVSANITINELTGQFTGSGTFSGTSTGGDSVGIYGSFHGEHASGVSGIYHQSYNPSLVGIIIGKRLKSTPTS